MATTVTGYSRNILTTLHGREIGLDNNRSLVIKGDPDGVTFSAASGAANVSAITIQVVNNEGGALAGVRGLDLWLSDAATGGGLTATTASGTVVATTGVDLIDYVAKKAKRVQSDATGKYVLSITDTAKTAFFIGVQLNHQAIIQVSTQLATANYG